MNNLKEGFFDLLSATAPFTIEGYKFHFYYRYEVLKDKLDQADE